MFYVVHTGTATGPEWPVPSLDCAVMLRGGLGADMEFVWALALGASYRFAECKDETLCRNTALSDFVNAEIFVRSFGCCVYGSESDDRIVQRFVTTGFC